MHRNISTYIGLTGLFALIFGLALSGVIFPRLKNYLIRRETRLENGTHTFAAWQQIPFPFKLKLYFFNVTNPIEIQSGLEKPKLTEIGPYIYDEFRSREILSIDEENDTIEFAQKRFYKFNEKDSGYRKENDIVTILNIGLVSTVTKVFESAPEALPMINDAIPFLYPHVSSVFDSYSVQQIVFGGMEMSCESPEVAMVCRVLGRNLPPSVRLAENQRDYLVSLFNHVNNTNEGPYTISSGLKSSETKGQVLAFKSHQNLPEWQNKCRIISGTDLTLNPNWNIDKKLEKLDFFVGDFCRSFSMNFSSSIDYNNIKSWEFKTERLFKQDEKCFCGHNECPPDGTMDAGPCLQSPIILSQPHFYNADSFLIEYCDGLRPDMNKHQSFIIVEPRTGVSLSVATRFQMNLFLRRFEDVDLMVNVSEGLFPFVWIEERADVPEKMLEAIRNNFKKLEIFDLVSYVFVVLGLVFLVVALLIALHNDKIIFPEWKKKRVATSHIGKLYTNDNNIKLKQEMHFFD